MSNPIIHTGGERFGRLVVIRQSENIGGRRAWHCQCDCGATCNVTGKALRQGGTKSCGCLHSDLVSARMKVQMLKHGHCRTDIRTGQTKTHRAWNAMLSRCRNKNVKNYKDYGGRGISVCERWLKFENFLSDMGEAPSGLTLDRINVNGDYEPGNCRWADWKTQQLNRRNNHWITFGGRTMTITQWEKEAGFPQGKISQRMKHGWTLERAITAKSMA